MSYQNTSIPVKDPWFRLACVPAFGARTLMKLWDLTGGDGEMAWNTDHETFREIGVTDIVIRKYFDWKETFPLKKITEACKKDAIRFVRFDDPEYPAIFHELPDKPFAYFIRGTPLTSHNVHTVAIVGTRRMTPYGKTVIEHITPPLVHAGCTIVSGLALGLDAEAHEVALRDDGRCVAIIGSGCDDESIYPVANQKLAKKILRKNGSIVSEFAPFTEGLPFHFPMRNRLIAGYSKVTVVVEAAKESGSLITAKLALDYNREVCAVPGSILSQESDGTNQLITQGAALCENVETILGLLGLSEGAIRVRAIAADELTPQEHRILQALTSPMHANDLAVLLKTSVRTLAATILPLQLRGFIQENAQVFTRLVVPPSFDGTSNS